MNRSHFSFLVIFLIVSSLSACRFLRGGQQIAGQPEVATATSQPTAPTPKPSQLQSGFSSPAYDIADLSPVIFPPVADVATDCLQGPEPDWSAPSARLFDWPDPFSLSNRLLCIYGFPAPADGWGFTVELADPSGNIYVETFTASGGVVIAASTGPRSYVPSVYEGVPYIGLPLFFGDPGAEGEWKVSAHSLDGELSLTGGSISVQDIHGLFILLEPPGNPFDISPLEQAADGQTAHAYLIGGAPDTEYVVALYSIDPDMAADFGLTSGEPAPIEVLLISTLVPQFAAVVTSDEDGNLETQFNVDASIAVGQYFFVTFPGVHGSQGISLLPMLVSRE